MKNLPPYSAIHYEKNLFPEVLRNPAKKLSFPLSKEDIEDIHLLETKFDQEENCAGLAGPQIGIAKAIIVFAAPENEELKKWRKDFEQTMDKTIWINPSYTPIGDEKHEDFEGCFSVINRAGPVNRFKKVKLLPGEYTLEISSPGLDRLLFTEDQFKKQLNNTVAIKVLAPIQGQRNFKGVLRLVENGEITLEVEEKRVKIAIVDMDEARVVPKF